MEITTQAFFHKHLASRKYDMASAVRALVSKKKKWCVVLPPLALLQMLPDFLESGFHAFQGEYEKHSVLLGKEITFQESGESVRGRVVALGSDGGLHVEGPDGKVKSYLSGDVTGIGLAEEGEGSQESTPRD